MGAGSQLPWNHVSAPIKKVDKQGRGRCASFSPPRITVFRPRAVHKTVALMQCFVDREDNRVRKSTPQTLNEEVRFESCFCPNRLRWNCTNAIVIRCHILSGGAAHARAALLARPSRSRLKRRRALCRDTPLVEVESTWVGKKLLDRFSHWSKTCFVLVF